MTTASRCLIYALLSALLITPLHAAPATGLELAEQLAADNNHAAAALEYRRLAMDLTDPSARGALYWMAAYEYIQAERMAQAERMLSQSENAAPTLETEIYLLRSETDRAARKLREAAFYLEGLATPERPLPIRTIAARRLAAIRLEMQDVEGAQAALQVLDSPAAAAPLEAISTYAAGKDKSPMVGGLLGLIPGLGYAYSGEYANGARSLLLNALCLWGLIEFIEDDEWGGVAVVGFAEVTFYSGSIYGGADAAVRYNRRRLRTSTRAIEGDTSFRPDRTTLPVLTLQYEF